MCVCVYVRYLLIAMFPPSHCQLVEQVDQIDTPSERAIKLFRDFWLYCIIMGFSDLVIGTFSQA